MPCANCSGLRAGALKAIQRGKVATAARIVARGAKQMIKAPAITAPIRKR